MESKYVEIVNIAGIDTVINKATDEPLGEMMTLFSLGIVWLLFLNILKRRCPEKRSEKGNLKP